MVLPEKTGAAVVRVRRAGEGSDGGEELHDFFCRLWRFRSGFDAKSEWTVDLLKEFKIAKEDACENVRMC